ncbi:putative aldouronate transport system permease protein [Paenibacillus phyllosphaerae]|uniref:Putative aldouronate transport system permease protein n=1 Tax=Paenibacillus phyllosphaerae TaxID=274593 RepID=A0A7W5AXC4_9BACL|nr:carbohydrate ABC transporter permease [Paenibacillus phyllosphaerae]MBB3110199.1 putative aldouronate transport system permease protein [Paenibacillus phyllosphaerae]
MRESAGSRLFQFANVIGLGLLAVVMFFPLYYVFIVSFTDPAQFLTDKTVLYPKKWSLEAYRYLFSTDAFLRSIGNSAFLAVIGTACSLAVSSSFAYALSQRRMFGRRTLLLMVLLTLLFSPGIIPHYMLVRELGLMGSLWALILPALANGWNVLLMKGFFDSIPAELSESAAIDGCSALRTWLSIIVPISLPAMAAFGLFYAVGYWNQFFNALLYLQSAEQWPIQVLLQNMLLSATNTDIAASAADYTAPPTEMLKMAAVVTATAPILAVYPFLQKHFAKGSMIGSVKG